MPFVPQPTVDLEDLRAFLAVVEHQSFTAAARALRAPKSSVSKRVASLEARLGVSLFSRTTRSVSVRPVGRALAAEVGAALESIERATERARGDASRPRGRVRVTAPVVFGDELLAPLIAPFLASHPEVQVELLLSDRRVDLVADGVDVAIRAGPMVDSALVVRRLGPAESVLVASPKYLLEHGAPRRIADLSSHRWCVFTADAGGAGAVPSLRGPRTTVRVDAVRSVTSTSQVALRRCLLDGAGIGLLPWYLAHGSIERGALVELLPKHRGPGGELQLLTVAGRNTGAVKAFVTMVSDAFRDERPWVRPLRAGGRRAAP